MKKLIKQIRRFIALSIITLLTLLGMSPFYIYDQFNAELPVARLSFQEVGPQQYLAELSKGDFCQQQSYAIFGDQWQLDASFMKWKGPAVMLGFESRYRLDRLEGRYSTVTQQNSSPTLAHSLSPEVVLDIFAEEQVEGKSGLLIDTTYGSSVYLDIDTEQIYTIYKSEDGLFARSTPKPQVTSTNGMLTIDINRACGDKPSFVNKFSQKLNVLLVQLLEE